MPDIVSGITAGAGILGNMMQGDAASDASGVQAGIAQGQTAESRRQFDAMRALLQPYVGAGNAALSQQMALLGLGGLPQAGSQGMGSADQQQAAAIAKFENSPYFQAITKQAENAILQNSSATGGLRGGNVQGALAGTRPILLQNLIDKQLANLSGLTSMGQNAAAGVGNAGLQTGQMINQSQGQMGAAQAGGILGQGNAMSGMIGNLGGLLASRFPSGGSAPPVADGGYSIGQGSAYGGLRAGL